LFSFGLQACSHFCTLLFKLLPRLSFYSKSCRRSSNIVNPKINTHHCITFNRDFFKLNDYMYVPIFALLNNSSGSRFLPSERLPLMFPENHRRTDTPFCSRQRNSFVKFSIVKNSGIVINTLWRKFLRTSTLSFKASHTSNNPTNRW